MNKDYGTFHIAFKILLKKRNKVLFLKIAFKDYLNLFDLPGGQVDKGEEGAPFEKILSREVKEEIGEETTYKIGNLAFQHWRYFKSRKKYILVNVYEAEYLSGKIKLSPEHLSYEWINPRTYKFKKKEFCDEKEYLAFRKYFKRR